MKYVRSTFPLIALAGAFLICFVVIAWQPDTTKTKSPQKHTAFRDTAAPKSADPAQINIQLNLDSVMQQANVELSKVNVELSKIDFAKINVDVQNAMKQIDYDKINLEVNKAMKEIDYNKINTEVNNALKEIDWDKMKVDVSMALDSAKMAINNIDWKKIQTEITHAQAESKKAIAAQKINGEGIQKQVQKSLQEAQKSLQKAQVEMRSYQGLISSLEKDGLIEKGKPYSVQLKDGILYINGVKQSKTVTDKYSRYYMNKKNFSIGDNDGDDL